MFSHSLRRIQMLRQMGSIVPLPLISRSLSFTAADVKDSAKSRLLYSGSHVFQIRVMLSMGFINAFYWVTYMATAYKFQGVVVEGIDLGGDYRLGIFGLISTSIVFYATNLYATRACSSSWESADKKRLGFQLYTIWGNLGRKIEVPRSNARSVNYSMSKRTSLMPVYIEGLDKNILLDRSGRFYENEELLNLLLENEQHRKSPENSTSHVDSKEKRIEWIKSVGAKSRNKAHRL